MEKIAFSSYALLMKNKLSGIGLTINPLLSAINDWNDIERGDLLKLFYEDGALAYILKNSLKSSIPANFTSHPYIKIRRALLSEN